MRKYGRLFLSLILLLGLTGCQAEQPLTLVNYTAMAGVELSAVANCPTLAEAAAVAVADLGLTAEQPPEVERPELSAWLGSTHLYELTADRRWPLNWQKQNLQTKLYVSAASGVTDVDGVALDATVAEAILELYSPENEPDPETVRAFVDALAETLDGSFPAASSVRPCVVNVSAALTVPEPLDRFYSWYCVAGLTADDGTIVHQATGRVDLICGTLDGGYGAWLIVYQLPPKVGISGYKIQRAWDALHIDMTQYPNL